MGVFRHLDTSAAVRASSLGIPFTPHVARHSFATWHHARGASELDLQKLGRWQHPQSVRRYTKIDVERVRAGINKVGKKSLAFSH